MERDDIELLTTYHATGDEGAFSLLVERHCRWILAAAQRRLGDEHWADDAAQAVFVLLATKASQLVASRTGSLSPWLFHVMHFTCSRLRRSQARRTELEKTAGALHASRATESAIAQAPLFVLMEDSIAALPPVEREMVVRRFYQGQSFAQIGSAAGLSSDAARKRVNRSLAKVKDWMCQNGDEAIPDTLFTTLSDRPDDKRSADKGASDSDRINTKVKETMATTPPEAPSEGGHQMISAEFLVKDVEANLDFFEKLGFPKRWLDEPDETGRLPRASLTAGNMGKIWIRRADATDIRPSPSINIFFWIDGGPDGLVAFRKKVADRGVPVTPIIDEYRLPNFNVTTPDGYSIAFFTAYVAPGQPPIVLVK